VIDAAVSIKILPVLMGQAHVKRCGSGAMAWSVVVAAIITLVGCKRPVTFKVAAAADLVFAFGEIGKAFEAKTGQPVTFSFGSTGQLATQISEGAPFDLFAAANVSFVNDVVKAGACDPTTKAMYARGRVGVWTHAGIAGVTRLDELADPRFIKIAIANPEHAPYGRAAKEALEKIGIWEKVSPQIVYGENIQQTLKFAQSKNAEAAIVALSLAAVTKDGVFMLIPEELHRPIDQALVVCKGGANATRAGEFATFVESSAGRMIMRRYGFVLPGETAVNTP
jgi:molybdate transport system substrate-binding protein